MLGQPLKLRNVLTGEFLTLQARPSPLRMPSRGSTSTPTYGVPATTREITSSCRGATAPGSTGWASPDPPTCCSSDCSSSTSSSLQRRTDCPVGDFSNACIYMIMCFYTICDSLSCEMVENLGFDIEYYVVLLC